VPKTPGSLKDFRYAAYCHPSRFNSIPQLIPHVTLLAVDDGLQKAPQAEFGRSEIVSSRRPHNWSTSSYPLTRIVAV
jgi:hypothetical protein